MKIAVVILNWNGQKLLEQFLPQVVAYSSEAQIYVADNASTDKSIDYLKTHYPEVEIIENNQNFGFAQGYNEALKSVQADVFALINSDIEVTKHWLKPIIASFENDKNVAVIQPKILDFNKRTHFEYAGAAGGFIDKYGFPYCDGRVFESIEADLNQYNAPKTLDWASGACFFIRSEIYNCMGGFDNDFFAHQEEIDLCWRIRNQGFMIRYEPETTVYHIGGATLDKSNPKKTFLNFRNSLLMLVKNLPSGQVFKILFLRMVLDGIAAVRFLFQGNFKHSWAVFIAHVAFYKLFRKNYKKRTNFQINKYYSNQNIVFNYYIRKRK
jgi:GT2 family glycosyltransferase